MVGIPFRRLCCAVLLLCFAGRLDRVLIFLLLLVFHARVPMMSRKFASLFIAVIMATAVLNLPFAFASSEPLGLDERAPARGDEFDGPDLGFSEEERLQRAAELEFQRQQTAENMGTQPEASAEPDVWSVTWKMFTNPFTPIPQDKNPFRGKKSFPWSLLFGCTALGLVVVYAPGNRRRDRRKKRTA